MKAGETGSVLPALGGETGLDGRKLRFQLLFFTQFIAGSGLIVFRNVYLEEMGLSGSAMGVIGFLFLATGVVIQPFWGLVTDYWRAERSVLAVGALVSALAVLAYPIASTLPEPFLLVALGTVVFSGFRAPIVPIATGMVLSHGYDYGRVRAFGSLAFAVGSLAFGFLVAALGSASIVYCYVFGMAVLLLVVRSLPAISPISENGANTGGVDDENAEPGTDENEIDENGTDDTVDLSLFRAVRALVTNREFLVVIAAMFLLRLSFMGGEAFLSVYMRAIDARLALGPWSLSPDGLTGVAWAINGSIEAVAFVYAVRLRRSYRWLLVGGGTAIVVPNLVYGLTTRPEVILAVQAFGGIGFALLSLAAVNLVDAVAAERVRSSAQTLLNGFGLGLGGATGQVVAGGLVDAIGIRSMYVPLAAIGFVGAAVGFFVRHRGRLDGTANEP